MEKFDRLKIIVLATTEQSTLTQTVRTLLDKCPNEDISEIVILMLSQDCPSAPYAEKIIKDNTSDVPVSRHIQKTPGLYPAVFEAMQLTDNCSHILIIGSDLEMDPNSVPEMLETAKRNPEAIVCASKFMKGSKRVKYGAIHYVCNRAVNTAVKLLLHIKGTEILSTFQIFPVKLLKKMNFTDKTRSYYQYTMRPLTMGAEYIEIPTDYIRRTEGDSNYNPKRYIDLGTTFIKTALDEKREMRKRKR